MSTPRVSRSITHAVLAVLAVVGALIAAGGSAEAKVSERWNEAWQGYGDAGYQAPVHKSRKAYRSTQSKPAGKIRKAYRTGKKVRYAALKQGHSDAAPSGKSITGGGVRWAASSGCLSGSLKSVVHNVAAIYGSVTVSSTCRSKSRNRAVGGAHRSHHLTGNAVDFRVHGNWRAAAAYLRGHSGGFHHYGGGLFHVDNGPNRRW